MTDTGSSNDVAGAGSLTRREALRVLTLGGLTAGLAPAARHTAANAAARPAPARPVDDVAVQSAAPLTSLLYRDPTLALRGMSPTGAMGVNALAERGRGRPWYVEEQRGGESAAIGGLVTGRRAAVEGALRAFDWGFARQTPDGAFTGTSDPFHSTSFFVAAVAHTALFARQAADEGPFPLAAAYADRLARYGPRLEAAAHWMTRPRVWQAGLAGNAPFTHRAYLVGAALGLTGLLTGDGLLVARARAVIAEGLARQRGDGVNPERGGYDSSYQMTGVVFAQYWVAYRPHDPLTPAVRAMLARAVAWEATRVGPTGAVSTEGNTRTAGQEPGRDGVVKRVAYSRVIRGFATWGVLSGEARWTALAWRTGRYDAGSPALNKRPLLP